MNRLSETLASMVNGPDLAIDLGTANTRVFAAGHGLVADVPTLGPDERNTTLAGDEASDEGAPLRGGVITDATAAAKLLKQFVGSTRKFGWRKPRAIACAPSDASPSEISLLISCLYRAGISDVKIIPEPLAAAVGAGLDISSPYAQAIIDLGAGVTDIAIIRSGELIHTTAVRLGCNDFYPAVLRRVERCYGLILPTREAERLIKETASVDTSRASVSTIARGFDRLSGCEKSMKISGEDVSDAIQPLVDTIMDAIRKTIHSLPPRVCAEVIESGISLCGGGAFLPGIKERVAEVTSLQVKVAAEPLYAVIKGASQMLAVGGKTGLWTESVSPAVHWTRR